MDRVILKIAKIRIALLIVCFFFVFAYFQATAKTIAVTPSPYGPLAAVTLVRQSAQHYTTEVTIADTRKVFAIQRAKLSAPDFIADDNEGAVGRLESNQLDVRTKWDDANTYMLTIAYPPGARVLKKLDFDNAHATYLIYGALSGIR